MIRHSIRLEGGAAHGPRLSAQAVHELTGILIAMAQRCLRLRVDGRSTLYGHPAWLDAAASFNLIGLSDGSTVLQLEAPALGQAAPEVFQRLPLWDHSPRPEQTVLSLVEEAVDEAVRGNAESDLLDLHILDSFSHFGRVLALGFDTISFDTVSARRTPVKITSDGLEAAERLRRNAPKAERTIVTGYLDELKHTKRAFTLQLPDGHSLKGMLPAGDPASFGGLWGKRVVIDGEATFKPSGTPSLLLAENIQLAGKADALWERLPTPQPIAIEELRSKLSSRHGESGMEHVFGRWPGDETDEQVVDALAQLD